MNWLLWREYRRNRWILAAGAAGVVLPYIIAVMFDVNRSSGFIGAFFLSCVFSQMTVALLGGNAVAGERADRSAEFIAYLPLRRSSTFASKHAFPRDHGCGVLSRLLVGWHAISPAGNHGTYVRPACVCQRSPLDLLRRLALDVISVVRRIF